MYLQWINTLPFKLRKLRNGRVIAGLSVQICFMVAFAYFLYTVTMSQVSTQYIAPFEMFQEPDGVGTSAICEKITIDLTDEFRVDTDGYWSTRNSFWAPNGLLVVNFQEYAEGELLNSDDPNSKVGRRPLR